MLFLVVDRVRLWLSRRKFRSLKELCETTEGECPTCHDASTLYRYMAHHYCEACWPRVRAGIIWGEGVE